jgi:hypothetical protein
MHARDYGFIAANPFGRKAFRKGELSKVVVKPGESLRLRYGILLHAGEDDSGPDLKAAYADYVQLAGLRAGGLQAADDVPYLKYADPEIVGVIQRALHSSACMVDFNGDGRQDLIYQGRLHHGFGKGKTRYANRLFLFEKIGSDAAGYPLFREKRNHEVSIGVIHPMPISRDDGLFDLIGFAGVWEKPEIVIARNTGTVREPVFTHLKKLRHSIWRPQCLSYADFNADGIKDVLTANEPGRFFIHVNRGTDLEPQFDNATNIDHLIQPRRRANNYTSMIMLCDWDDDGDNDVLTQYWLDQIYFHENVSQEPGGFPQLAAGRNVVSPEWNDGHLLYSYFMIPMQWCDADGDGKNEILAGSNPGHVTVMKVEDQRITAEHVLEGKGLEIGVDALAVPSLGDLNGDGLLDLVVGDCSGWVKQFLNVGTATAPKFGPMSYVEAAGERILVQAPGGSCQGPVEARWGYVQVKLYDWDGNGLTDLLLSDIHGRNLFYENVGSATKAAFDKPISLLENGKPLVTRWRCKPTALVLDGKRYYLQTDENGRVTFFEQDMKQDAHMVVRKASLKYTDGTLVKLDNETQTPTFSAKGRTKIETCDWDGNGVWDLVYGCNRVNALPEHSIATLYLLRNVGTCEEPVFEKPKAIRYKGEILNMGAHSCAPAIADLDSDGKEEFIVGDEDGMLRIYQREDLGL